MILHVTNRQKCPLYVRLCSSACVVTNSKSFILRTEYHFNADHVTRKSERMNLRPCEGYATAFSRANRLLDRMCDLSFSYLCELLRQLTRRTTRRVLLCVRSVIDNFPLR